MRAAAILGLGTSPDDLRPFRTTGTEFALGLPADPAGFDSILIFGGDGTIHRHLAQLVKLALPVLVVPCGSGNDFAHALGLPKKRDSLSVWKEFCAGRNAVRPIDLGTITELRGGTLHYFACVAGAGLDGEIARRANAMPRWLRARGGYALSLPLAMASFRTPRMHIEISDGSGGFHSYHNGPALVLIFANTPVYGDGMRVAPRAKMDDGLLDICLIGPIGKLKVAALFPSVYFGRHLGINGVQYEQVSGARISTDPPLDVYADGEFVCHTPVEIGMRSAALRVIAPI
jgi:diacylglycerol kinase (ATP)